MRRLGAVLTALGLLLLLGAVLFGIGRGYTGLIKTYDTLASPEAPDANLTEDYSASMRGVAGAVPVAAVGVALMIAGMVVRSVARRRGR